MGEFWATPMIILAGPIKSMGCGRFGLKMAYLITRIGFHTPSFMMIILNLASPAG